MADNNEHDDQTLTQSATDDGAATSSRADRGFFSRTWVRIAAVVVAAIVLLGGGMGIGAALASGDDGRPAAGDHREGPRGERGGGCGERDHRHDDDRETSESDPTPSPTPSATP